MLPTNRRDVNQCTPNDRVGLRIADDERVLEEHHRFGIDDAINLTTRTSNGSKGRFSMNRRSASGFMNVIVRDAETNSKRLAQPQQSAVTDRHRSARGIRS
jgi:hypothetical protein